MSFHLPYAPPIKNNRKRTRGRKIQVIQEATTVVRKVRGIYKEFPNPRYMQRRSVKVIHAPFRPY